MPNVEQFLSQRPNDQQITDEINALRNIISRLDVMQTETEHVAARVYGIETFQECCTQLRYAYVTVVLVLQIEEINRRTEALIQRSLELR